ncbi:AAA family ATPase [Calothrix sp. CCY 0018]|uniref:AAA family ATPase n=1 Tax=Calothrix sp. CCY 0018 TaxID=3103864 RepID=UPI0039C74C74
MIPVRVYVENFMSYREGQELLFDGAPLWVLSGENGTGKSTIFDAIRFALYGSHRGGSSKNQKDLINHQADALTVEFDFLINEETYRISRTVPKRGRATREVFRLINSSSKGNPRIKPVENTDSDSGFKDWVKRAIGLDDKAFTSCILLIQGKSDKLIEAPPSGRYEILKQLIDLTAYDKLHKLANERRKHYEAQLKNLKSQLESSDAVSDAEFNASQEVLKLTNENCKKAQQKLDNLGIILEQSKQWQQLNCKILELQSEVKKSQELLARTDEIEQQLTRSNELKTVLPLLSSVIKSRQRIIDNENEIEKLNRNCQQLNDDLELTSAKKNELNNNILQIKHKIENQQKDSDNIVNRLVKLIPVVEKLSQVESIQKKIQGLNKTSAAFPSNLDELLQKAESEDNQLEDIRKTLPWLKQLAQERNKLVDAVQEEKEANKNSEFLQAQLKEYQTQQEKLIINVTDVREIEKKLSDNIIRIQTEHKAVIKRRDNFEEASHQPICELCGQKITPEHAQAEKTSLDTQIANKETDLSRLNNEYEKAEENLNLLSTELDSLNKQIQVKKNNCNQNQNQLSQAQRDVKQYTEQIKNTFINLPAAYQINISPDSIDSDFNWVDTSYPTELDLKELNQRLDNRQTQTQNLNQLRNQFSEWKGFNTQQQTYIKQLAELEESFSISEAQEARSEKNKLQVSQNNLKLTLEKLKEEQNLIFNKKKKVDRDVNILSNKLRQHEIDLGDKKGSQNEIKWHLKSDLESLPSQWQESVTNIDEEKLEELDSERKGLTEYEILSNQLNTASGQVAFLQQEISKTTNQIEQLPNEAKRASQEVEQELTTAKSERDTLYVKRQNAQNSFHELTNKRNLYQQLEKQKLDAERNQSLYKILCDLLGNGKQGLQLKLLRDAEQAIVQLANEILDGLSRGKMRLELRGEAEESSAESSTALDLVAYNQEIGSYPTPIAQISGSQRFRVAVSLALAIGQYAGQGARQIESVIIDEGFGSLDKNGRDDMIQELNELQHRLARIILVSHLEDFSSAFSNGYSIELVNQASKVKLLESV